MSSSAQVEELFVKMLAMCEAADRGDVNSQYQAVLSVVQMLGCRYAIYKQRRPVPLTEPRYQTVHNLPARLADLHRQPWPQGLERRGQGENSAKSRLWLA